MRSPSKWARKVTKARSDMNSSSPRVLPASGYPDDDSTAVQRPGAHARRGQPRVQADSTCGWLSAPHAASAHYRTSSPVRAGRRSDKEFVATRVVFTTD